MHTLKLVVPLQLKIGGGTSVKVSLLLTVLKCMPRLVVTLVVSWLCAVVGETLTKVMLMPGAPMKRTVPRFGSRIVSIMFLALSVTWFTRSTVLEACLSEVFLGSSILVNRHRPLRAGTKLFGTVWKLIIAIMTSIVQTVSRCGVCETALLTLCEQCREWLLKNWPKCVKKLLSRCLTLWLSVLPGVLCGASSMVLSVGESASEPKLETSIEIVTATVNRWQNLLAILGRKVSGMNIEVSISATVTTGLEILSTVPRVVLCGCTFLLTRCLTPLIMMTVLLIMTLTVSISLNRASMPTEQFSTYSMVKALMTEIGIVTSGTSDVCYARRNMIMMTMISSIVLSSATIIEWTDRCMNMAALQIVRYVMFLGKLCLSLLTPVWIVLDSVTEPVFGILKTVIVVVLLPPSRDRTEQSRELSLISVMLVSAAIVLLVDACSMTVLKLLGELSCLWVPIVNRRVWLLGRGGVLTVLVEILTPRLWTVTMMLLVESLCVVVPVGLT